MSPRESRTSKYLTILKSKRIPLQSQMIPLMPLKLSRSWSEKQKKRDLRRIVRRSNMKRKRKQRQLKSNRNALRRNKKRKQKSRDYSLSKRQKELPKKLDSRS